METLHGFPVNVFQNVPNMMDRHAQDQVIMESVDESKKQRQNQNRSYNQTK